MRCLLLGKENIVEKTAFAHGHKDGLHVSTVSVFDVLSKLKEECPDFILLDLDTLNPNPSYPIFQSGHSVVWVGIVSDDIDREKVIEYYEIGFDLIINMPIDVELLLARVNALKRRTGTRRLHSTHLLLNEATQDCFIKNSEGNIVDSINLTSTQYDVLRLMIQQPRRVWSRSEIAQYVNSSIEGGAAASRSVDVLIARIRQSIESKLNTLPEGSWQVRNPFKDPFIHTVRRMGYTFHDQLLFRSF